MPRPKGLKYDSYIRIRLTKEQKERLENEAKIKGISISKLIRVKLGYEQQ